MVAERHFSIGISLFLLSDYAYNFGAHMSNNQSLFCMVSSQSSPLPWEIRLWFLQCGPAWHRCPRGTEQPPLGRGDSDTHLWMFSVRQLWEYLLAYFNTGLLYSQEKELLIQRTVLDHRISWSHTLHIIVTASVWCRPVF